MTGLNALTVSIGVLAAIITWLFLSPLAGLSVWAAFIAWAAFFHNGGGEAGLTTTIANSSFGALVGWVALLVIITVPLAATLTLPVWAGICVGLGAAAIVAASRVPALASIPTGVYGFGSIAAYALLATKLTAAEMTAASLANPLINIVLSMAIGALFGYVSQKLAGALTKA